MFPTSCCSLHPPKLSRSRAPPQGYNRRGASCCCCSSDMAASKKPADFCAAMRRQNSVTSKLKNDMATFIQTVVELTKATRASNPSGSALPMMSCNVLYDMNIRSARSSLSNWDPCASLGEYLDEHQLVADGARDDPVPSWCSSAW
ncbi:hypothetical protein ACP70R_000624 [Stipagrostis hirtigluma subsp. patula]